MENIVSTPIPASILDPNAAFWLPRAQVRPSRERSGGGGEGGAGLMTSAVPLSFSSGGGSMGFGGQVDSTSASVSEDASSFASLASSAASVVATLARGGVDSESHSWLASALAQCRRVLSHAGVTLALPLDNGVADDGGETAGRASVADNDGETRNRADPACTSAKAPLSKRRTDEMEYLSSPLSRMATHDGLVCLMLCAPQPLLVPSHSSSLSAASSADSSSSASSLPAQPLSHSQVRVR